MQILPYDPFNICTNKKGNTNNTTFCKPKTHDLILVAYRI
jgi:hypothetical protein